MDYDEGRGGYGNIVKAELTQRQSEMLEQMGQYEAGQDDGAEPEAEAPGGSAPANPRFREEASDDED